MESSIYFIKSPSRSFDWVMNVQYLFVDTIVSFCVAPMPMPWRRTEPQRCSTHVPGASTCLSLLYPEQRAVEVTPIDVISTHREFTRYRVILSSVASAGWCGGAQPAGLHQPGLHSLGVSLNATAPTQSSLQSQPST